MTSSQSASVADGAAPQLQQMSGAAERVEDRIANVRDARQSCHERLWQWQAIASTRAWFASHARARRHCRLASIWGALEEEARQAVALETEQIAALEERQELLELTAVAAWRDYEEIRGASLHQERVLASRPGSLIDSAGLELTYSRSMIGRSRAVKR